MQLAVQGVGGLRVFNVSDPGQPEEVARLPMFDAHDVHVHWPWAYVADGVGGLAIVDVRAPIAPKLLAGLDLNGESTEPMQAIAVASMFQYSRPMASGGEPVDERGPIKDFGDGVTETTEIGESPRDGRERPAFSRLRS